VSNVLGPEDVAVVIPTQNRWPMLRRTLEGLAHQTVAGFETIVVADRGGTAPSDLGQASVVVRHSPGVGAARNTGAMSSARRLLLFLGDDTIPEPDLVERHVHRHRQSPADEVGVLGLVEWHPEVAGGRIQRWLDWSDTQFDYRHIVGEEAGWGRFYSSNVSLKRARFLDVGGFDEDFLFGYEDLDLGLRLNEKGFRLLYEPAARVLHVHRYDLAGIRRRFMLVGGAEFLMVRKHPDFDPHFRNLLMARRRVAPGSAWPWLVDLVPDEAPRLRAAAERRAGSWYAKALTPSFVAGWAAAAEMAEVAACQGPGEEEITMAEHFDDFAQASARVQAYLGEIVTTLGRGARVLHYRCGVGTAGFDLVGAGYDVAFAEVPGAPADLVRCRLHTRGSAAPVFEIGSPDNGPPSGFDLALALDSLADTETPLEELDRMERCASTVAVSVPTGELLAAVLDRAGSRLVRRRRFAGGEHLVVYRSPGARPSRWRAGIERVLGRVVPPRRPWAPAALT
jgi:glycosyltransferase involved in cell wall biosynthesis